MKSNLTPYCRRQFLLVSITFYATICLGQYDGGVTPISPVPPNAAALFKPAERPIGSFSGTVPVEIPIHNVAIGNINVPISLNYATGGIKVSEVASNVGLGWSLSAGGSITRVMNGIPDDEEGPGLGYLYNTLKPSGFPGPYDDEVTNASEVVQGNSDMEPDIYYYNFPGYSGKFFFDESGNVVMDNQDGLKIMPVITSYDIIGWIITDLDGTKYYFGSNEALSLQYIDNVYSTYSSLYSYTNIPPRSPTYNSTWHLAEIRDMNEENIVTFNYNNVYTQYDDIGGSYNKLMVLGGTSQCTGQDFYTDETLVTANVQENYLTSISTRAETVSFSSTTDRIDYGGSKLNSISIYDSAGVFKKKFNLNYDYFTGSASLYSSCSGYGPYSYCKRLKLKGISEFGSTGTDSLAHTFDYFEDVNLPSRLSYAVDYWGYYNGQDFNWTFLPNYPLFYYSYGLSAALNNADRRANPSYSYANSLKKIHFPTGGYRQFQYEGNKGLLEQGNQLEPDDAYINYQSFSPTGDSASWYSPSHPAYTRNFIINSTDGGADFSYVLTGFFYDNFSIVLTNTDGYPYVVSTFNDQYSGDYILPNGHYELDLYYDNYFDEFDELDCNWTEWAVGTNTIYRYGQTCLKYNMNLGGIRVKEIDDYDHLTGKTYSTKYKYNLFADSTTSSGIQIFPLTVAHYGNCSFIDCQTIQLYPKSCYPMASAGGSYVYYPEVTTVEDNNGYVQREYSFAFDGDGSVDISQYPIIPPDDNGWLRGKLMVERTFDQTNMLLKKTLTSYPLTTSSETGAFPHNPPLASDALLKSETGWKLRGYISGGVVMEACWNQYNLQGQFSAPGYIIDSVYSPYGNQVTRTENYYYTDLGLPFLKQQKIYINNSKTREINYKYAFNNDTSFTFGLSSAEHSMKATLLSNNYLKPLETTMTLTPSGGASAFSEGNKFSSGYFNSTRIHIATAKHFTTTADSIIQNYSQYDTYGNLCEQYKSADVRTVYLWGYNNTLPVAKIEGSDYTTCMSYVSNSVLQVPSSDLALRNEIGKIRAGLWGTKAQVTTYTYSRLIGMTSQVDPAGNVTYYTYDNHGRLTTVLDQHNNVLKKYNYNVVNPQ